MEQQGTTPLVAEIRGSFNRREHMTTLSARLPIHLHDDLKKICRDLEVQQNELLAWLFKGQLPRLRDEIRARKGQQKEMF